jgi:uncharacterized membrane protein YfcA
MQHSFSPAVSKWRLVPFWLWLAVFYGVWLTVVAAGSYWAEIQAHWGIALAMLFGSYVAGSTPMGGGTVGFPVLVLLFDFPGSLGRNFGLTIQSVGMVSASIYILCQRQPLEWLLLRGALIGSLISTPLAAAFVAPHVSDLYVKLTFAVVWASFGLMHLAKLQEFVKYEGISLPWQKLDTPIGLAVGSIGGIVAAITGVGIDMIIYVVLVLLYRSDLKIAIPTSVLLMAFTSLVGAAANLSLAHFWPERFSISSELLPSWLAAAPVVALGAPFGALVVSLISRTPTLIMVSLLCIAQFVWTVIHEQIGMVNLAISLLGILFTSGMFYALYWLGMRPENDEPCNEEAACQEAP